MKVNYKWFSHLEIDEDKERFKKVLVSSREVLEVLGAILEKEYMSSIRKHDKKKSFLIPAWSEHQADGIGERRTLKAIIDLIDLEKYND